MNMKCTQNIYRSANGINDITYYVFQPEGVPLRGVVQIAHGVCDYFTRYTLFARYLCSLGFVVCGNDHLGHGASAPKLSDLGFFAVHDGWRYLVQDVECLTDILRARYPGLPFFLLGHSMGSLIVRLAVLREDVPPDGVILCGSVGPQPLLHAAVRVADSIARSKSPTYRSGLLAHAAFRRFNRRFSERGTAFDWLTRDRQIVEMFQSDEKCNFLLTSSAYRDLFTLALQANSPRAFRHTPHALSMLFLSGDHDPIGGFGEGVQQAVQHYRSSGVRSVDLILYANARHEILNEVNRQQVYHDIAGWLEMRLDALPPPQDAPAAGG